MSKATIAAFIANTVSEMRVTSRNMTCAAGGYIVSAGDRGVEGQALAKAPQCVVGRHVEVRVYSRGLDVTIPHVAKNVARYWRRRQHQKTHEKTDGEDRRDMRFRARVLETCEYEPGCNRVDCGLGKEEYINGWEVVLTQRI
jgi:hypothetical protein